MKLMQRLFFVFLALLLVASSMAACEMEGPSKETTQTTIPTISTTAASTEEVPLGLTVLSDKTQKYYTVVFPAKAPDSLIDCAQSIAHLPAQHQKGLLNLPLQKDWQEGKGFEILVGYTNRPESRKVMDRIGYDDFAIVQEGEYIVVAAHREERMRQAVEYLCKHLLKIETDKNGRSSFLYTGDYVFAGEEGYLFDEQNKLADYSIVYRDGSDILKSAAEILQAQIREKSGITVAVKSDATPETEREILLGMTNRALSQKHLSQGSSVYDFSYLILTEGKKLLIGSSTDDFTVTAVERFAKEYLGSGLSYLFNLKADTRFDGVGFTFSESPALAEGAEMRIMSFNILSEYYGPKVGVEERKNIVMATILTYSPDVLGLQETTAAWQKALNPMFEGKYAFVDTKTERGKTNMSPLVYNLEKVTLLEHGVKTLASGNSENMRVISWGYFERKSDGKRFIVANTHWDLTAMPESRTKQAIEMGDFVSSMSQKYNCPAITVGDYNTQSHQPQFQTYLDHSGLSDAGLTAKVINRNYKSTHDLYQEQVPAPDILAIDHVFYSADVEALYYNMLIDKDVLNASDHFPVYADLRFKE